MWDLILQYMRIGARVGHASGQDIIVGIEWIARLVPQRQLLKEQQCILRGLIEVKYLGIAMTAEVYSMTGGVLRQAARAQVQGRAPQSAGLTCRSAYLPGTIPQSKSQLIESSSASRRINTFAPSRRHSLRLNPSLRVCSQSPSHT